ncbi:hypothetical protein FRC16_006765 [Serendipita sp. 398]|nr:hypothetical protein FRC16_006765 [Serendipita sp. 398]
MVDARLFCMIMILDSLWQSGQGSHRTRLDRSTDGQGQPSKIKLWKIHLHTCHHHKLNSSPPATKTKMAQATKNESPERCDISDHALIGNMSTAALVSLDGSIESYCVPYFDSPSVFARILDKDKGGHFSINPTNGFTPKQAYLPSSNVRIKA